MSRPVLTSERLEFLVPEREDALEIFERYAGDAEVTQYVGWPRHRSLEDTAAFLAFSRESWAREGAGPLLLRLRGDGRLIGSSGLAFEGPGRAMTGYVLARDSWGMGYATEALLAMVQYASSLGGTELSALCHAQHRASSHVLEKAGFALDPRWSESVPFPNLGEGGADAALRYVMMLR